MSTPPPKHIAAVTDASGAIWYRAAFGLNRWTRNGIVSREWDEIETVHGPIVWDQSPVAPEPAVTDEDVHDVAEWLHPLWYDSDNGRAQTWSTLSEHVRGALESRAAVMRARWVADELQTLADVHGIAPFRLRRLAREWREGKR